MQIGFQKEPAIPVRIGIHTGDILFNDEEIIGDGVNVASRIESLAISGSVLISDKVYDEIKNQKSINTSILRKVKLKNVEKPIDVYAISNVGLIVPKPEDLKGKTDPELPSRLEKQEHQIPKLGKRVLLTITISIIITLLIVVYLKFGTYSSTSPEIKEKSIAVLAFENLSGDPDQEYFGDGISEEILNSLVNVAGLRVAGRTSAFSFKGKNEDIRTIGEKLDVTMVLEGSVRKSGDQLRITAQLINVKDGFHIFSETYDREMEDIFAVQEDIANRIVEKLKLQVQESADHKVRTQNMEAYELLLKGSYYFFKKDFEYIPKAMEYFQKAVELDPDFAEAYALIGETYLYYGGSFLSISDAFSKARTAATKAISLNELEPRAHKVLEYIHLFYDWDWEGTLFEYKKAIQYGLPENNEFITYYDIFVNNDFDTAIEISRHILDTDPLRIESHWQLGLCYYFARRFEEALASFNNALELDPDYSEGHRWKGVVLGYMGKYEEAINSVEKALEITNGAGPAKLDLLLVKILMGNTDEVVPVLNDLEKSGEHFDPMDAANLYTLLGMYDNAIFWIEKGYRERSNMMVTLKYGWIWDPLRDDPRFIEIYGKMNFSE
jgi:TolB-like protein/lipoprotein NlpI